MKTWARLKPSHLAVLFRTRRNALEQLFARTAAAFGSQVPAPRGRNTAARLREFASFTRMQAEEALAGGKDLAGLEERLFRASYGLGAGLRFKLRLRSFSGALAAAELIYRGLGIRLRCTENGEFVIRSCGFAAVYTPHVCRLMSSLDRGLLAGLTGGGELRFCRRITEGAANCLAYIRMEK